MADKWITAALTKSLTLYAFERSLLAHHMFKHILIDLSLSSEQECELKSDNFDLILTYECETHMFNVLRGFEIAAPKLQINVNVPQL